jgi:uncharacterized protein (TIGR00369 family)
MEELIQLYRNQNQFGKWLGMDFKIQKAGKVEYKLTPKESHEALKGMTHGGVLAGMMDGVLGVAALSAVADERKYVATVEFKINYLAPAVTGETLLGLGQVIKKGGKILVVEGKIYNTKNELIATALGTFRAYLPSNS